MYRAFGDASLVSLLFFLIGGLSMLWGLLVPWLIRFVPRRWLYTLGVAGYIGSAVLATLGHEHLILVALMMNMAATVTVFVCFNAYILDYVASVDLGRCETLKMFHRS
jgi:hypothetical protein